MWWFVLAAAAIVAVVAGVVAWQNTGDEAAPTDDPAASEQAIQAELNDGVLSDSELQAARTSYRQTVDDNVPFWIGMRETADFSDAEIQSLAQLACESAAAADSAMAYFDGIQAAVGQSAAQTTMAGSAGVAVCQTELQPYLAQLDALQRFVSPRM